MSVSEGTVVTSRIRLARNLSGYPFASRLTSKSLAREIIARTYFYADKYRKFKLTEIDKISPLFAERLKERYVISEALKNNRFSGAAITCDDDAFSIMINEEDHIRQQRLEKGFNLKKAYDEIYPLDRWLDKNLKFAKNDKLGYLTACPTNLGTGLRASCMMFLPGLTRRTMIGALLKKAQAKGLTVRGVFGEGSEGESYLYQVSNEVTLGIPAEKIVSRVENFVQEISEIESTNLNIYYGENEIETQDAACRAAGILRSCRLLSFGECSRLISDLKIGAILGVLKISDVTALDDLLVTSRPACIKTELITERTGGLTDITKADAESVKISENDENAYRAEFVKKSLNKILI